MTRLTKGTAFRLAAVYTIVYTIPNTPREVLAAAFWLSNLEVRVWPPRTSSKDGSDPVLTPVSIGGMPDVVWRGVRPVRLGRLSSGS